MAAEVLAGLGALKSAFDLARGLKDIHDAALRNAAVIDLQERILSAQQAQGDLVSKVNDLEAEVARLKSWENEKRHYELKDLGNEVFVYALRENAEGFGPPHSLCVNCFSSGKKSILQKHQTDVGRWTVYACNSCDAQLYPHGGGPEYASGAKKRGR